MDLTVSEELKHQDLTIEEENGGHGRDWDDGSDWGLGWVDSMVSMALRSVNDLVRQRWWIPFQNVWFEATVEFNYLCSSCKWSFQLGLKVRCSLGASRNRR